MRKQERAEWLRARIAHKGKECLPWPFAKNWNGYGTLKFGDRITYAHRVMCILAHGEPPAPKLVAAHSCGNGGKGCVNPRHLAWKTPSQNQHDRSSQGTARANRSGRKGKLTMAQVEQIRALKGQLNQREIAKLFGCSFQNISMIQQGKSRTQQRNHQ